MELPLNVMPLTKQSSYAGFYLWRGVNPFLTRLMLAHELAHLSYIDEILVCDCFSMFGMRI
jgi:hypothetical protein